MEWKFRKDFEVMPGIVLKYGSGGLHTEMKYSNDANQEISKERLRHKLFKPYHIDDEIKSASIDQLTTDELKEFKQLLLESEQVFNETTNLLYIKTKEHAEVFKKLSRARKSIFHFMLKKKITATHKKLTKIENELDELKLQLNYSCVRLEIESGDVYKDLYKNVEKAFQLLNRSEKKWDITSLKFINKIKERTSASSTITRSEVILSEKNLSIIQYNGKALCFHNINGGDLYLYPGFMIVHESRTSFAVINYTDLKISFAAQRFIETERVPTDTEIIDKTWFKVNKDGSPDKRFVSNYQIPIVRYGELHFESKTGLHEVYCFSDCESAMLFHKALFDYLEILQKADSLLKAFK
jgi:hypothetical protein